MSPNGKRVAAALDGQIDVYRIADDELLASLPEHAGDTYSLQFSHDGSRLLSAGRNGTMYLWNTQTWNRVLSFNLGAWIQRARFATNDTMIVAGTAGASDDGIIHLFRAP